MVTNRLLSPVALNGIHTGGNTNPRRRVVDILTPLRSPASCWTLTAVSDGYFGNIRWQ